MTNVNLKSELWQRLKPLTHCGPWRPLVGAIGRGRAPAGAVGRRQVLVGAGGRWRVLASEKRAVETRGSWRSWLRRDAAAPRRCPERPEYFRFYKMEGSTFLRGAVGGASATGAEDGQVCAAE
ncbi:hypothetical protein NL108_016641 [Boleophthalmus pectinirostris]|nr:hypothetical protein NL108_016641 [Boleophthalmus pectinirostris]